MNVLNYSHRLRRILIHNNKLVQFLMLTDDASRIKLMFSVSKNDNFDLYTSNLKNLEGAKTHEAEGDKYFKQGSNCEAVTSYNEAIKICPQNELEGQQLYAILIEKRSSVFFVLQEYQKGIDDIHFIKQYGLHPNPKKLNSREAKAYEALRKSGNTKKGKREELSWFSGNLNYPALSKKLTIKKDEVMGRKVVATDDIKTGEILAIESPYASVVNSKTNCSYCALSTNQVYACPKCQDMFCSIQCVAKASIYHQYECTSLLSSNEKDLVLAFRMVTQRPLQQVIKDEELAKNENKDDHIKDDYYHVSRLMQHKDAQNPEVLLKTTCKAVLLLKLLRTTTYFRSITKSTDLSNEEVLVGELFLKYLGILRNNNIHGFNKVQNNIITVIGGGVYPTVSLFSHSCDPSVRKYNIRNMVVVRSIKPIKSGDVVFGHYGQTYWYNEKRDRDIFTAKRRFLCKCQACIDNWPLLKDMDPQVIFVRCGCSEVVEMVMQGLPKKCPKCKNSINMVSLRKTMQGLVTIRKKAMDLYNIGHFEEAQKLFAQILDEMFTLLAPPTYDLVEMQNLLGTCLILMTSTC